MSFSVIVDIFIGLIGIYLLLGMIGTALQEAIAGWLNLRGKYLRQGLQALLAHGGQAGTPANALFERVAAHSLVQPAGGRLPSYVAAANFGTALVDGLLDGSQAPLFSQVESSVAKMPDGPAKQALAALIVRAGGDLDRLQASLERWFDDAMDRVSGAYKRLAHNGMLVFGVAVALLCNIDTVDIASALRASPELREATVELAKKAKAAYEAATAAAPAASSPEQAMARAGKLAEQLASPSLPMGWSRPKFGALAADPTLWLPKLLGLLITALAVSLGAPFWFDLLQKVLNLRTAGPKPAKAAQAAG